MSEANGHEGPLGRDGLPALALISAIAALSGVVPSISVAREMMGYEPLFVLSPEYRDAAWGFIFFVVPVIAAWTGIAGIRRSRYGGPVWCQVLVMFGACLGSVQLLLYLLTFFACMLIM